MEAVWKQPDGNGGYYTIYHETSAEMVKYSDTTVANILDNSPLGSASTYMQNLWTATDATAARKFLGVNRATIYDECPVNWRMGGLPSVSDGKITFGGAGYARRSSNVILGGANPFTFELLATSNEDSTSAGKPIACFYFNDNNYLWIASRNNVPRFGVREVGTSQSFDGTDNIFGTERHLALTYDGTEFNFFVDGVQVGSLSQVLTERSFQVWLGASYEKSAVVYGKSTIDEFRISDICRYSANFTPSSRHTLDENTVTLLHFDD